MDFPQKSSEYTNHDQVFNDLNEYAISNGIVKQNSSYDYYFITNISLKQNEGGTFSFTPGCHLPAQPGGVQLVIPKEDMKFDIHVASFETPEKVTAHEMGHYVGLHHPFEQYIKNKTQTNIDHQRVSSPPQKDGNFMDYSIPRRTWFKYQMTQVNNIFNK